MTPEVGVTYRAGVTLPTTLLVTDANEDGTDHIVWGHGPDGATYRMPASVFAAVYAARPELDWRDVATLTVPAPS